MQIRKRAADFWLNLLFWQARRNPAFVRAGKPVFLWGAWTFAAVMRQNLLRNARWLRGKDAGPNAQRELARSVLASFYDFVCDVGRSAGASHAELLARIGHIAGDPIYQSVREEKKGAILLTAHMGCFEVAMAALLRYEKRIHVLFRRDALGLFEQTRSTFRKRLGILEAPVDEGLAVWVRLREALEQNDVVLIQGDRVMPGQKGEGVPFLGGQVLLPVGPFKLALASGSPILPIFSIRKPDGMIELFVENAIRVHDGQSIQAALHDFASVLENYVRRYPDQWLMIHRVWCEDAE